MRILVTGGLGFIGSAVVRQAIADGHSVLNLDSETYAANRDSVQVVQDSDRYHHLAIDICDGASVAQALADFAPNRVIHLAAESHVDRSIDEPARFVTTNVIGTTVMLQAAQSWLAVHPDSDFRFVHVSSDEVFGSLGPDDEPFAPTTAYDPRSPYSASKAASDHFARAWFHSYGLPVIVTNSSNNYGPYQYPEKLVPLMTIRASRGDSLPVYGTGANVRDWIHVDDHARGLLLTAADGAPGQTYLFGGGAERSNLDVVQTICDLVDELVPTNDSLRRELISFVQDRPGHDHRYAIDCSATTQSLGWAPSFDFQHGLRDTVAWYVENESYWAPILERNNAVARLGTAARLEKS